MTHKEKLGFTCSLVSGAAFATLAIFSKSAYLGGANVPSVLFLRFWGASLIFWIYGSFRKVKTNYDIKTILILLFMGGAGYGTMSALFLFAVSRIPASLAGMLLYLYPALVTVAALLLGRERLTINKIAALAITSLGLVLVLGASFSNVDLAGVLMGVGAAFSYTIYIIIGSSVLEKLDSLNATTYIMTGAAVVYGIFGLVSGSLCFSFGMKAWLAIGGIALVSTVVAVNTFWLGVQLIGPSKTSIISSIEPLVTVILAWWLLGEKFTPLQMLGGLLIILGVIVLQYRGEKSKGKSQQYEEY